MWVVTVEWILDVQSSTLSPVSRVLHMVMANGSLKELQEKQIQVWPLTNWYKNIQPSAVNNQRNSLTKHVIWQDWEV
jgi:hypothetical protein